MKFSDLYISHIDLLKTRYQAICQAHGMNQIILHAGIQLYHTHDDHAILFKPTPHCAQWVFGVGAGDCLFYDGGENEIHWFHIVPDDFWHAPPVPIDPTIAQVINVHIFSNAEDADQAIRDMIQGKTTTVGPGYNPDKDVFNALDWQRAYKTSYEVACIEEANKVAGKGHNAAKKAFDSHANEWEIYMAFLSATGETEAALPYGPIVANGNHSAILHYQYKSKEEGPFPTMLIDAGVNIQGYASDITRTWMASKGNATFKFLLDEMETIQLELCQRIQNNTPYGDLHVYCHQEVARILSEAKIINMAPDEVFKSGLTKEFLPHGLGHQLGVQVHDIGGHMADPTGVKAEAPKEFPTLRNTRTLETGHVVTIEPGLYFIPMLLEPLKQEKYNKDINWELIESLYPYGGIRIEDNVFLSENGPVNLTRPYVNA